MGKTIHWGPPAPAAAPCGGGPPAPHGPAGPHGCPIAAVPTVGPPRPLQPQELCPTAAPLFFQAFLQLGEPTPAPELRARALVGSTAAAPPKAGSALSKGPNLASPPRQGPGACVWGPPGAPVPLSQRLCSAVTFPNLQSNFPRLPRVILTTTLQGRD